MSMKARTVTVRIAVIGGVMALGLIGFQMTGRGQGQPQQGRPQVSPHEFDWRSKFPRWPLLPGESALGSLDGQKLKQNVNEFTAIALKYRDAGNQHWGRLVGSEADAWGIEWTVAKLKAAGVQDAHNVPMDLPQPQWRPISWEVTAGRPDNRTPMTLVSAQPATGTVSTPAGGLSVEPIWLGLGCPADFAGRDVRGKAVVLFTYLYGFTSQHCGGIQKAAADGAAAIFVVNNVPGNVRMQVGIGGGSGLKIPYFALGKDDGERLREMIENGPTKVNIKLDAKMVPGLKSGNVFGTLPGRSEEDIVILAHRDGYFQGAGDNASGMAVMIGLAEYFAKIPQAQRPRTIRFLASTGHHHQGPSGPATLTQEPLRQQYFGNTVFLINLEHVAWTQTSNHSMGVPKPIVRMTTGQDARRWFVNGSPKVASLFLNTMRDYGVPLYDSQDLRNPGEGSPFTDLFANIGFISSPPQMHTDQDVPDMIPGTGLEQIARATAKIIIEVSKMNKADLVQGKVTYSQDY